MNKIVWIMGYPLDAVSEGSNNHEMTIYYDGEDYIGVCDTENKTIIETYDFGITYCVCADHIGLDWHSLITENNEVF